MNPKSLALGWRGRGEGVRGKAWGREGGRKGTGEGVPTLRDNH